MINKVILVGNLGADPDKRFTTSGKAVANMRLAVYGGKDKTEWVTVVAFDKTAEVAAEYLAKGRQIYVEGRLQTRTWDDKEGNKRYSTEVVADVIKFLGGKPEAEPASPPAFE